MGDQQHPAPPLLPHLGHQALRLDPGQCVQRAERLVEQQQIRVAHQRPRQRRPLRLAPGERLGPGIRPVIEPHLRQRPFGRGPFGTTGKPQQDVPPDPLPRHQSRCLERHRLAPRDPHLAPDLPIQPGQHPQQGRLPAPAASQQRHELTCLQLQLKPVDDRSPVELPHQFRDPHGEPHAARGIRGRRRTGSAPVGDSCLGAHCPVNVGRHCNNSLSRVRTRKSASSPRTA